MQVENGIIVARFNSKHLFSIDDAIKGVTDRLELQGGQDFPILIFTNGVISSSKEVRAFMAAKGVSGISKGAFLVNNLYEQFFVRFFLMVDAPSVPTKVFFDEKEARNWLKAE